MRYNQICFLVNTCLAVKHIWSLEVAGYTVNYESLFLKGGYAILYFFSTSFLEMVVSNGDF